MPDALTRADGIQIYLSGATSDGGTQTDPDASLGNYRSSTKVPSFTWERTSPIANIDIDFIEGANGTGTGSLTAPTADTLKWTPPGGSQGDAVTIANGETKIVEGGGSDGFNKYIKVTRTSATGLTGTESIEITDKDNNVVGFDDVTNDERVAGDDEYRMFVIKNESGKEAKDVKVNLKKLADAVTTDAEQLDASGAGTVETTGSFASFPEPAGQAIIRTSGGSIRERIGYTSRTDTVLTVPAEGRGLGITSAAAGASDDTVEPIPWCEAIEEAPSSQPSGQFTSIGDEDTAPGGLTFENPITDAEALDCGDLADTYIYGIWLHRIVFAGLTASKDWLDAIEIKFDGS